MMYFLSHFKKFLYLLVLITAITLTGVIGFIVIEGFKVNEAFYMTIITISTVGFTEVHPLSPEGRWFTSFLIITSIGIFAYALSAITTYIIDGELVSYFKTYRVINKINKLEGHVIICGYGRNGKQAVQELKDFNKSFVIIESDKEKLKDIDRNKYLFIDGDATSDEVLHKANINNAAALITTIPKDSENLFVVLTAKELNSKLQIISRASQDSTIKKLKRAGANSVIMPDKIGGSHMASLVVRPDVMELVDSIVGQEVADINLEEVTFDNLPDRFKNKSIRDIGIREKSGANIIGFKSAEGEYVINPSPDTILCQDAKIFVLGTAEQTSKFRTMFKATEA